jgi:hypothetical protein
MVLVGWVVVKLFEVCLLGMWRRYGKMDEKEKGEKTLDGLMKCAKKNQRVQLNHSLLLKKFSEDEMW